MVLPLSGRFAAFLTKTRQQTKTAVQGETFNHFLVRVLEKQLLRVVLIIRNGERETSSWQNGISPESEIRQQQKKKVIIKEGFKKSTECTVGETVLKVNHTKY